MAAAPLHALANRLRIATSDLKIQRAFGGAPVLQKIGAESLGIGDCQFPIADSIVDELNRQLAITNRQCSETP